MENTTENSEVRLRQLTQFADWMIKSGLSPLDYKLVEEKRSDGVTLWYYQRRKETEEIQTFDNVEF